MVSDASLVIQSHLVLSCAQYKKTGAFDCPSLCVAVFALTAALFFCIIVYCRCIAGKVGDESGLMVKLQRAWVLAIALLI